MYAFRLRLLMIINAFGEVHMLTWERANKWVVLEYPPTKVSIRLLIKCNSYQNSHRLQDGQLRFPHVHLGIDPKPGNAV